MKLNYLVVAGLLLLAVQASAADKSVLKTQEDRINYAIGVNMAGVLKLQGLEIKPDLVIQGMKDAFSGGELLLSDAELHQAISLYQNMLRKRLAAKARTMATAGNKKAGETFLAENKKKQGVVALPSGLQYKIIKSGAGKQPTDNDTVECNIRGSLINGTEFENSYSSGHPTDLKLSGGINPGLREALKLMPVGSKWQIFVPAHLAYGEQGLTNKIGPNETLIYELELLAIK